MRRICVVSLVFLVSALSLVFGRTHYISHVAGSSAWETYAVLDNNAGDDSATFMVKIYDTEGIIETLTYDLSARETVTIPLRAYGGIAATVWTNSVLTRVRVGYVASESSGGGTAEFDAPLELLNNPTLSLSDYTDILTWSGFALWNCSSSDVEVTPRIMLRNGTEVDGTPFTMAAWEKKVNYFDAEFGHPFGDIASVTFFADQMKLSGLLISGMENERLLFTGAKPYSTSWASVPVWGGGEGRIGGMVLVNETQMLGFYNNYWSLMDYRSCRIYEFNVRTGEYVDAHSISGHVRVHKVMQAGSRVFLAGEMENRYFVGEYDPRYHTMDWTVLLDEIPTADIVDDIPMLRKISAAVNPGGSTMMVCLTDNAFDLKRYRIRTSDGHVQETRTSTVDHLLGDVFYYNDAFYYFRVDRSSGDTTPFSKVNLYHNPTTALMGGGHVFTLPSTDVDDRSYHDGASRSVYQSGALVKDGVLYVSFQYCTLYRGMQAAYAGPYLGVKPGVVVLGTMDLADTSAFVRLVNTFVPCQFGARTSIVDEPGGVPAAFVADQRSPHLSTRVIPFLFPSDFSTGYYMQDLAATISGALVDPIFVGEDILFGMFTYLFTRSDNQGVGSSASYSRHFGRKPYGRFLQFGPDPSGI